MPQPDPTAAGSLNLLLCRFSGGLHKIFQAYYKVQNPYIIINALKEKKKLRRRLLRRRKLRRGYYEKVITRKGAIKGGMPWAYV